jgi:hypothetical protein
MCGHPQRFRFDAGYIEYEGYSSTKDFFIQKFISSYGRTTKAI